MTSEPAGAIDCPGDCSHAFTGSTSLTLRATPATGWVTAQNGSCITDLCTVPLNDFNYTIHVYFRPRAKLQVWPNGDGAITLSPTPADWRGEPDPNPCTPDDRLLRHRLRVLLPPGHGGDGHGDARPASSFLGWSAHDCPGAGTCAVTLSRDATSLVARFTPARGAHHPGRERRRPASSASLPGSPARRPARRRFPTRARVTLIALPDPAAPFISWKFGCTPSAADPRRCVLTATNRPNWVGVALGEDAEIGQPTNLSVLFDVTREGKGSVNGRELDCGANCEHQYAFGSQEELRATPASGWRFTGWNGACAKARDVPALRRAGDVGRGAVHGEPRAEAAEREGDREEGRPEAQGPALGRSRRAGEAPAPPGRREEAPRRAQLPAGQGSDYARARGACEDEARPAAADDLRRRRARRRAHVHPGAEGGWRDANPSPRSDASVRKWLGELSTTVKAVGGVAGAIAAIVGARLPVLPRPAAGPDAGRGLRHVVEADVEQPVTFGQYLDRVEVPRRT